MIHGEMTMKSAVRPPRPSSTSQKRLEATRHARFRSPLTRSSLKTGTNADDRAASATSARTVFGIRNATSKALIAPTVPKYERATISRTMPRLRERPLAELRDESEEAREAGGEGEDRRGAGEPPPATCDDGRGDGLVGGRGHAV